MANYVSIYHNTIPMQVLPSGQPKKIDRGVSPTNS